jgi:hypothetical protein
MRQDKARESEKGVDILTTPAPPYEEVDLNTLRLEM